MKKDSINKNPCKGFYLKLLLIMKLSCILLLLFSFSVSAKVNAQNLTLNLKDANIEKVIREIQHQSTYKFVYDVEELSNIGKISIRITHADIKEVMELCMKNTDYTFSIVDDVVIIRKKIEQEKIIKITGIVKDTKGAPIPGVTVMIKGTAIGTTTDFDGKYSISVPNLKSTLIFSFIGMEKQEIQLKGKKELNVILKETAEELGEVVVTGFFNRAVETYTGSVKTVKKEEILEVNPTNLLSALSVIEPSFHMVENNIDGSNPNSLPEFEVRGNANLPDVTGSFKGSTNMPTFIMDGFEVSCEKVFDLDPQKIASVTILKDAAATAIYGSRAANGVVVITTQLPKPGAVDINYNLDIGGIFPDLRDYDVLDAKQKLQLEVESGYFDKNSSAQSTESRADAYNAKLLLVQQGNNTYWLNKPLRNVMSQKHSISLEGGSNNLRFSISGTYDNAPGVMKGSGRIRKSIGMLLQYTIKNKVVLRNQITYNNVKAESSPYGSFSDYVKQNPYYKLFNEDGKYVYELARGIYNPMFNSQLNVVDFTKYNEWRDNLSIDWIITDNFRLKGNISISQKDNAGTNFKPASHTDFAKYSIYSEDMYRRGKYVQSNGSTNQFDSHMTLSYKNRIEKNYINVSAVVNMQDIKQDSYTFTVEGFPDDKLDYISFALQYASDASDKVKAYDNNSRLLGFLLNANYTYDNKYLFDFSYRTDASSKFGANNRWAPFWSLGLGWNIEKEDFLKDSKFVSRFKIRGSIGYTGSQSYNPYQAITTYQYWLQDNYRYGIGASMKGLGNSNLKWQRNLKSNFGCDISLFSSKLTIVFDAYKEKANGLLTNISLPASLGFSSYRENLGKVQNSGLELSIRGMVFKTKNSYINLGVSVMRNRNKLVKLSSSLMAWNETQDATITNVPHVRFIEGQSTKTIWGMKSYGINPASGVEILSKKDGTITDTWTSEEQVPIGVNEPDLEGNFNLNARWKGFQFSTYLQFRLGGDYYNQTLVSRVENANRIYNCDKRVLDERWKKPGDITYFKSITLNNYTQPSSRFINKYDYLKLSSLNISYDFGKEIVNKLGASSIKLSFSMNDIFRISSIKMERGTSYPFARSMRVSLRIRF